MAKTALLEILNQQIHPTPRMYYTYTYIEFFKYIMYIYTFISYIYIFSGVYDDR